MDTVINKIFVNREKSMTTRILILTGLLLLLTACAVNNGSSEYGYLNLSGSLANREAWVDGNQIGVDPADDSTLIRLKTGAHALEIRSHNRILLSEEISVEPGQTLEITVP